MKIDPNKILIPIGLVLATIQAVVSFITFYNNIGALGTDNEWKFYFSLAGFLIFFWMWSLLITVIVGRWWWQRRPQRH
jgi:hypothetical protein